MRVMRESEVPAAAGARRFGHSRTRPLIGAAFAIAAASTLIVAGQRQNAPPAYFIAAALLLLVWFARGAIRARFRPSNWLAMLADDGMYLKYRSYLNHHFPDTEPCVVFIPFRELRAARLVRSAQTTPAVKGSNRTTRHRTLVRLDLREPERQLAEALAKERALRGPRVERWYGSSAGRFRHYPVRLSSPAELEVEWPARRPATEFLGMLATHVDVESVEEHVDFTTLKEREPQEQEARLIELVETGQTIVAIKLARSLYGLNLTDAKTFVDGLSGEATTKD
jgi:hypothetical protein